MAEDKMKQFTRIGVYGIAIQEETILLVSKSDQDWYRNKLDLPGGGIEFGETAKETLEREFFEETGLSFQEMYLLDNVSNVTQITNIPTPLSFHHLGQLYIVKGCQLIPNLRHELLENPQWYKISELKEEQLTPFALIALRWIKSPFLKSSLSHSIQVNSIF